MASCLEGFPDHFYQSPVHPAHSDLVHRAVLARDVLILDLVVSEKISCAMHVYSSIAGIVYAFMMIQ